MGGLMGAEDVLRCILHMELSGASLMLRPARRKHPGLIPAATQHFGSWGKALQAAGIDSEAVAKRRRWTADRVIQTIHQLARQGIALNYCSVSRVDSGVPGAARRAFGSWDNALLAAGYDPDTIRIQRGPWTAEELIALIQSRAAAGLPIGAYTVVPPSARMASQRLFGSWTAALRAAGVPNPRADQPVWSKEVVLAAIRARLDDHQAINCMAVVTHASRLYNAARRYFGSWEEALRAGGIDPASVRRTPPAWTPDSITAAIRRRAAAGLDMRVQRRHPAALVRRARQFFGSWQQALDAAGVEPGAGRT